MICKNCGFNNLESNIVCSNCGTKLRDDNPNVEGSRFFNQSETPNYSDNQNNFNNSIDTLDNDMSSMNNTNNMVNHDMNNNMVNNYNMPNNNMNSINSPANYNQNTMNNTMMNNSVNAQNYNITNNDLTSKGNKKFILIVILVVLLVVVVGVGSFLIGRKLALKENNNSNSNINESNNNNDKDDDDSENNPTLAQSYQISFAGYTLSIPNNYLFEVSGSDFIAFYDSTDSWAIAVNTFNELSYSVALAQKDAYLQSLVSSFGLTNASITTKSINGTEVLYVTAKYGVYNFSHIFYQHNVTTAFTASVMSYGSNTSYEEKILEILKNAKVNKDINLDKYSNLNIKDLDGSF